MSRFRLKINLELIRLNALEIDSEILPEASESKGVILNHDELIRRYMEIQDRFQVSDLVRVWKDQGRSIVIQNYACLKAYQKLYADVPEQKIACLVISEATRAEVIEYCLRIKELTSARTPSHLERLLQVKILLLNNPNLTFEEFKEMRGVVGRVQSKEGKQAERDFKLASSDLFFCGLLGIRDMGERPLLPDVGEALYPYGFCANQLLGTLGNGQEIVARFHEEYLKYISDLETKPHSEDEEVKPIFTWSSYNQNDVLNIARWAAGYRHSVQNRPEDRDPEWMIESGQDLSVKVPSFSFIKSPSSDPNFKKLVEAAYKSQILSRNSLKVIRAVKPQKHGVRASFGEVDLPSSGVSEQVDQVSSYLNFIRYERVLYYAVKSRLLKSLRLSAGSFGFVDRNSNQKLTWDQIFYSFDQWFEIEFSGNIVRRSDFTIDEHPLFFPYQTIHQYLEARKNSSSANGSETSFNDFVLELFSHLFMVLDAKERNEDSLARSMLPVARMQIQNPFEEADESMEFLAMED